MNLINSPNPINPNVYSPVKISIAPTNTVPPKGSFWGGVSSTIQSISGVVAQGASVYSQFKQTIDPPRNSVTPTVYEISNQKQPGISGGLSTPILPNTYITLNPDGSRRIIDEQGETLTIEKKSFDPANIAVIAGVLGLVAILLIKRGK